MIMAYGKSPGTSSGLSGPCRQGPRGISKCCLSFLPLEDLRDLLAKFGNQLIYEHLVLEVLDLVV